MSPERSFPRISSSKLIKLYISKFYFHRVSSPCLLQPFAQNKSHPRARAKRRFIYGANVSFSSSSAFFFHLQQKQQQRYSPGGSDFALASVYIYNTPSTAAAVAATPGASTRRRRSLARSRNNKLIELSERARKEVYIAGYTAAGRFIEVCLFQYLRRERESPLYEG